MSGKFDSNLPDVTLDAEPPETLRDRFAMAALQGMLAAWPVTVQPLKYEAAAHGAFFYADACMEARK